MSGIPVVDISYLVSTYLGREIDPIQFSSDKNIQRLSQQVVHAFTSWGFVYFKGHQIPQSLIQKAFKVSKEYFNLASEVKLKIPRDNDNRDNFGYVPFKKETFEVTRPFDLKECFNFLPKCSSEVKMATSHPEFWSTGNEFYTSCSNLAGVLFLLFDVCLGVTDRSFLAEHHRLFGDYSTNATTLRLLYYPNVDKDDVMDRQLRCGEHSDYGSFTLLFQDQAGGLQVSNISLKTLNMTHSL